MARTTIKICLFVGVFTLFCSTNAFAIAINFHPVNQTANVGDSIDVDIVVSGLLGADQIVSAYDLFVEYDTSVLSATSVSFGSYLSDLFFPSLQFDDLSNLGLIEFGEISFLFDDELALSQPDSFILATLSFDAISAGPGAMAFVDHPFFGVMDIKGRDAQILDVIAGEGSVNVAEVSVSVPEPGSLILIMIGMLLLLFSFRQYPVRTR